MVSGRTEPNYQVYTLYVGSFFTAWLRKEDKRKSVFRPNACGLFYFADRFPGEAKVSDFRDRNLPRHL